MNRPFEIVPYAEFMDTSNDYPGVYYFRHRPSGKDYVGAGQTVLKRVKMQLSCPRNSSWVIRLYEEVHGVDILSAGPGALASLLDDCSVFILERLPVGVDKYLISEAERDWFLMLEPSLNAKKLPGYRGGADTALLPTRNSSPGDIRQWLAHRKQSGLPDAEGLRVPGTYDWLDYDQRERVWIEILDLLLADAFSRRYAHVEYLQELL